MDEYLAALIAYPTVLFTVLLGLAVLYWLSVSLGALDVDVLDGDAALDAAGEAGEGALEGAAESASGVATLLGALKLRSVPLTVSLSFVVFYGWLLCFLGMQWVAPLLGALPAWAVGTGVLVAASALAVLLTSMTIRPLVPVFETHAARGRTDLIGHFCTIRTGRVDATFGQAEADDGGAGLLLSVRCDRPNRLGRGDRALIIDYDPKREAFLVEPIDGGGPDEGGRR